MAITSKSYLSLYGHGFIPYALERGGYSEKIALDYSLYMRKKMGWNSYGDPKYVQHVMRYYIETTVSTTSSVKAPSSKAQAVVDLAMSFKGKVDYQWAGTRPDLGGADCSGYTQYVYKKAAGVKLGRDTLAQIKQGTPIAKSQAQPGDLIFFKNTYRPITSHVGIVIGNGQFIGMQSTGGCSVINYNTNSYWAPRFETIRRVL